MRSIARAPAAAAHLCLTTRRVAAFHFPRRTLAASTVAAAARKEVFTAQEAQELLKQGYTYVDVRTPEEFTGDGHAPGAVNVPLGPTLPQDFKAKFPDNNAKLLVACRGGNRSTTALNTLGEAYPNAVNFRGSWMAWVQAGLPLER